MPAAAVIPAPIAYIKVVAVKKLVVGCVGGLAVHVLLVLSRSPILGWNLSGIELPGRGCPIVYCEKIGVCFKQAYALNVLAWNNKIGL